MVGWRVVVRKNLLWFGFFFATEEEMNEKPPLPILGEEGVWGKKGQPLISNIYL